MRDCAHCLSISLTVWLSFPCDRPWDWRIHGRQGNGMKGPGVLVQFLARTAAPTFSYLASLSHVSELSLQTRSYFMDSGGDDNLLAASLPVQGSEQKHLPGTAGKQSMLSGATSRSRPCRPKCNSLWNQRVNVNSL